MGSSSQQIRCKTKTNHDLVARFSPHFKQFGCFHFEFSIAPKGILWSNFGFGFTTINQKVSTLAIKQSLSKKSKNVWDCKRFKTFVTVSHDQSHVMYIPPKSIHHEGVPKQISQFFWDAMAEIQVETNVLIVQFKCNATDELSWVHSARCPVGLFCDHEVIYCSFQRTISIHFSDWRAWS